MASKGGAGQAGSPGVNVASLEQVVPGTKAWICWSPISGRIGLQHVGRPIPGWSLTSERAPISPGAGTYNTGGGQLLDWIGHHCDIAHWGLDFDRSGPSEVEAAGDLPAANAVWNTAPKYRLN